MENLDQKLSPEQESTPKYDAIVVLGRGIGKDSHGRWKPLSYFVESSMHSGIFDNRVEPDNEASIVGGGNANTLALFHFYKELSEAGSLPQLVIFAAGRPNYLAKENPQLSEGSVMRSKFLSKLTQIEKRNLKTVILDKNKNTADDMAESLRIIQERGLQNIVIITVDVQIERAEEFLKLAREQAGVSEKDVHIDFKASEDILMEVSDKYKRRFGNISETKAYKKTEEMEERGTARLRAGTYFTTGPYAPSNDKST